MNRTTRPGISGALAVVLAVLLASASFAAARPPQGTNGEHGRTVSKSGSGARSAGSQSGQRANQGGSSRSAAVGRSQSGSNSPRGQVSTPRSVPPQQRQRAVAPQASTRSRPQSEARQPAYRNPSQARSASPRVTEPRGRGPVVERQRQDNRSADRNPTQVRPTSPREIDSRGRSQVVERQRNDNSRAWQATSRTQQPGASGRVSGNIATRRAESDNDRGRNQEGRLNGLSSGQNREQTWKQSERQDGDRSRNQSRGHDGGSSYQRYDDQYRGHRTQQFSGRVHRMEHGDGGYRVWLYGSSHCFWVPEARFRLWPLHIGLTVSFGGFWNSAGYYNIYDYGPSYYGGGYYGGGYYGGGYYGGGYYSPSYYGGAYYGRSYNASSILQGYVDRFDYASGTMVVRDDSSGRYATVLIGGSDTQFGYLQPGDWVTLSGVWTRSGYFDAYRIDELVQR
jgi:hypothetical protein